MRNQSRVIYCANKIFRGRVKIIYNISLVVIFFTLTQIILNVLAQTVSKQLLLTLNIHSRVFLDLFQKSEIVRSRF